MDKIKCRNKNYEIKTGREERKTSQRERSRFGSLGENKIHQIFINREKCNDKLLIIHMNLPILKIVTYFAIVISIEFFFCLGIFIYISLKVYILKSNTFMYIKLYKTRQHHKQVN